MNRSVQAYLRDLEEGGAGMIHIFAGRRKGKPPLPWA